MTNILAMNVNPPLSWLAGVAMLVTAFCVLSQSSMRGKAELGWRPTSTISRFFMWIVAIVFFVNSIRIFFSPSITIMGVAVSMSMASWRFVSLIDSITEAYRHQSVKIAMAASSNIPNYK